MSDYMKRYICRNRRRRSAHIRKQKHHSRNILWKQVGKIAAGAAVVAVAAFIILKIFLPSGEDKKAESTAATGQSVSASGAAADVISGGISESVASVPLLPPQSIAEPTPKPRSRAVALTFDDGPDTENTPKILTTLNKYHAHATFFVVGNRVASRASCLKQVIAQGSEIGNHSWRHEDLSLRNMKDVNKSYNKTASTVKKLTGYKITFLRPPYGAISNVMRKKLKHPMILWSIDTLDWKSRNEKSVCKMIKKNVSDGDIILLHDLYPSTEKAIEKIVPWLVKQDYDIVTVSELMRRKGIHMKNGKAYGSAR